MRVLPLSLLAPGELGIVRQIAGGQQVRGRLSELGLIPGIRVRVSQSQPYGPLLIALGESRVALGRGVAQKVMVEQA